MIENRFFLLVCAQVSDDEFIFLTDTEYRYEVGCDSIWRLHEHAYKCGWMYCMLCTLYTVYDWTNVLPCRKNWVIASNAQTFETILNENFLWPEHLMCELETFPFYFPLFSLRLPLSWNCHFFSRVFWWAMRRVLWIQDDIY